MAAKNRKADEKTRVISRAKKEPEVPAEPVEQDPSTAIVVPDYVPEELDAVQPVRTEFWVQKIETYLRDQIWQQVGHEQYEAIIEELKERL